MAEKPIQTIYKHFVYHAIHQKVRKPGNNSGEKLSNKALGWVFDNSPYTGTKLVIHLAVADVVNDVYGNTFWMSNENLAKKCNTSRQNVNIALKNMVEDGFLERINDDRVGRGNTIQYRFLYPVVSDGIIKSVINDDTLQTSESVKNDDTLTENVMNHDILELESVMIHDTNPIDINPNNKEPKEGDFSQEIGKVWNAYIDTLKKCDLPAKRFNADRKRLIARRLKEWQVDELIKAVTGLEFSDFHRGKNDNGKSYCDLELILRNTQKIEQFMSYHDKKQSPSDQRKHVNDSWGRERRAAKATVINLEG